MEGDCSATSPNPSAARQTWGWSRRTDHKYNTKVRYERGKKDSLKKKKKVEQTSDTDEPNLRLEKEKNY